MFAGAINKAVKGTLHFSHMYPNGELKAFEEHLLIKCYNRFARHSDGACTHLSKSRRGGSVTWGLRDVAEVPGAEGSKAFQIGSFSAWRRVQDTEPSCPLTDLARPAFLISYLSGGQDYSSSQGERQ